MIKNTSLDLISEIGKGERAYERNKRDAQSQGKEFPTLPFEDANNVANCLGYLKRLNHVIDYLYSISEIPWIEDELNSSSYADELLKQAGISGEDIDEFTHKLEKLRIILFGDAIDWNQFYDICYQRLLGVLLNENAWLEKNSDECLRTLIKERKERGK